MPTDAATVGPVPPQGRILALDVARGFALLGILLVNVQMFFEPFGRLLDPRPPADPADAAVWWFVALFCEGKFYPLFSMLFGMGLVLQVERARAAGRPFRAMYLRRLALLAVFGIMHIVFVWAGDILLVYSVAGLVLLLCRRLSVRALLMSAAGLMLAATLFTVAAGGLGLLSEGPRQPEQAAAAIAPAPSGSLPSRPEPAARRDSFSKTPFGRLMQGFENGTAGPPDSPLWIETETQALRDGPFSQALLFRLLTYTTFLVFMVFGFGWHVLAMFMLGAALMRLGIFDDTRRAWQRRLVILGAAVGFPLVAASTVLSAWSHTGWVAVAAEPLAMFGATLMSLGYLGGIILLVASGRAAALSGWGSRAGRMALSVYLSESILATFFSYHWGLGWFGRVGGSGRVALALGIYAALVVFASLWLRVFRMGPMEWLWRAGTYLRAKP